MKLAEKIAEKSIEEIVTLLKENGIKENRLNKAVAATYLPGEVEFTDAEISGEEGFVHIRMITKSGDGISLGRLQAAGFVGEPTEKDVLKSRNDTFYLRSNTTPNAWLSGNQAAALKKLIGKKFKTEKVTMLRTKFVDGGYDSIEAHETAPFDTYRLIAKS